MYIARAIVSLLIYGAHRFRLFKQYASCARTRRSKWCAANGLLLALYASHHAIVFVAWLIFEQRALEIVLLSVSPPGGDPFFPF
jgi:hypothetical protein